MLLILAGVTISYISGGGIINKTKVAINQYEQSDKKQEGIINEIDDYMREEIGEYGDNSTDEVLKTGDYVNYNPTVSDKSGTPVDSSKLTYTSFKGNIEISYDEDTGARSIKLLDINNISGIKLKVGDH